MQLVKADIYKLPIRRLNYFFYRTLAPIRCKFVCVTESSGHRKNTILVFGKEVTACVCARVRACQYLLREIRRITKEAGGDRGRTCQIRHSMSGTSLFCLHIVIYLYLYYSTVPVLKSKLPCTYRHIPFFLNLFFVANILKLCNTTNTCSSSSLTYSSYSLTTVSFKMIAHYQHMLPWVI
jgi:hypothetical protein